MVEMTQENPSVQFDCRAICLNCSAMVTIKAPWSIACGLLRPAGIECQCGRPEFVVVQADLVQ